MIFLLFVVCDNIEGELDCDTGEPLHENNLENSIKGYENLDKSSNSNFNIQNSKDIASTGEYMFMFNFHFFFKHTF